MIGHILMGRAIAVLEKVCVTLLVYLLFESLHCKRQRLEHIEQLAEVRWFDYLTPIVAQ